MSRELTCCISGSFDKFKPEIDAAIREFTDLGVIVLEPGLGWLSKLQVLTLGYDPKVFRPLPREIGLKPGQIENRFLKALGRSDFLYVENPNGYIGNSAALEIGFALARNRAIYSRFAPNPKLDPDPVWCLRLDKIKVLPPSEVVKILSNKIPRRSGGKTK